MFTNVDEIATTTVDDLSKANKSGSDSDKENPSHVSEAEEDEDGFLVDDESIADQEKKEKPKKRVKGNPYNPTVDRRMVKVYELDVKNTEEAIADLQNIENVSMCDMDKLNGKLERGKKSLEQCVARLDKADKKLEAKKRKEVEEMEKAAKRQKKADEKKEEIKKEMKGKVKLGQRNKEDPETYLNNL